MWTYEIRGQRNIYTKYGTKREALFYAALCIRPFLVRFPDEEGWDEEEFLNSIPDIYIYNDGELDEIIEGRTLV